MEYREHSRGKATRRALARALGVLFLAAAGALVYLNTSGFPDWLTRVVVGRLRSGDFVVVLPSVKLDAPRGVVLKDVRVYRKGVVGPPCVEASRMDVGLDMAALLTGHSCVRYVRIDDALVRLPMLHRAGGPREGHADVDSRISVEVVRCMVEGVAVEDVSFELVAKGETRRLVDIRVALMHGDREGTVQGDATYNVRTRAIDGQIAAHLDPRALLPILDATRLRFPQRLIRRFEFRTPASRFEGRFSRACAPSDALDVAGRFWVEDCSYRGVDLLRADGELDLAWGGGTRPVVAVKSLVLVRSEGTATGDLVVYPVPGLVEFKGTSRIAPKALVAMVGLPTNALLNRCEFSGPVQLVAEGVVSYRDRSQTDLRVTGEGRDLLFAPFTAETYSFALHRRGFSNTIERAKAQICGGDAEGTGVFVQSAIAPANVRYHVEGRWMDVNFGHLAATVAPGREWGDEGRMHGSLRLGGVTGAGMGRTAKGEGSLRIKGGKVFLLPVFGGLSTVMARVVPGLDFVLRQTDVRTDFAIADGRIHTDTVQIEGDVLSLSGRGDYFLDKVLDFDFQLKLLKQHTLVAKVLRLITYPLSKLFEFRLRGTVQDPVWYPVNFSRELLERVGLLDEKNGP